LFSRFFINRPIFASVLSIVIVLAGLYALSPWGLLGPGLPVAQYPEIAPPTVEVSAIYPGANSRVVADTVAAPIEQQVNGVEGMLYMSSQCTNDGAYTLTVTFQNGVDLNIAQVLVQNRVTLAQPILPDVVKRGGVAVKKKSPSVLMIVNLFSPNGTRSSLYLSNYATIQLKDELARLPGVGDITYLGQRDYSMRVWLDPQKLDSRRLTSDDVVRAIGEQNTQVAAGQTGQPPAPPGQIHQLTITTMGRLIDPDEFAEMIIKADASRLVRLRDVARVELGAQGYDQTCTMDTRPTVALSIYQLPGSNALEVAAKVRAKMQELKARFPTDVDYDIVYDTTPFINESIHEVFNTLRDAVILVAVVVLLFLQSWRSAIIPLIAVPVAIIGTFAVMAAMGFSLNTLTLFGLVLAIGIVVDDAIVVVEAVHHHIERGLSPKDATILAMEQVSGPVVAVGLVLSAVFVPCAFISGITGQFYRQFALTIAVSTVISAFNSLTLSPALAALLLRPHKKGMVDEALPRFAFALLGGLFGFLYLADWLTEIVEHYVPQVAPDLVDMIGQASPTIAVTAAVIAGWVLGRPLNRLLVGAFHLFNVGFDFSTALYTRLVGMMLRVSVLVLLVYGGLVALTYWGFTQTPTGFIPVQDRGYLLVNVQLPDAAAVERTRRVMKQIEKIALATPGVKHTVAIAGQSVVLGANAPNFGSLFVMLDGFQERTGEGRSGEAIAAALQERFDAEVQDGLVNVFGAPAVEGLSTAGGFKLVLEDRGVTEATSLKALQKAADKVVQNGNDTPGLRGLFTSFRANTPWLYLDIDRARAKMLGVSMTEVFGQLQNNLGSFYVNDFNRFGRTWQVKVQADARHRKHIESLRQIKFKNQRGDMVPFDTVVRFRVIEGPVLVMRYNMYGAAAVNGSNTPEISSRQAIDLMEEAAHKDLPRTLRPEWTELAFLQLQTGSTAVLAFILAVVLAFLVLAAQYESWSLPLAVILVVPMCLLFSIFGVVLAHLDINIFTQVGFIVLVGLACKNAILIVEFAKARREAGVPRREATLEACQLRLRPIMMTSFAFILGVVPLMISEGAGAEMRRTLGTAVFSGMLGVTLFGIFLTPVFYYVIQWLKDRSALSDELGPAAAEGDGQPPDEG
jgi:multidrug efflux pump subunit AcrB